MMMLSYVLLLYLIRILVSQNLRVVDVWKDEPELVVAELVNLDFGVVSWLSVDPDHLLLPNHPRKSENEYQVSPILEKKEKKTWE